MTNQDRKEEEARLNSMLKIKNLKESEGGAELLRHITNYKKSLVDNLTSIYMEAPRDILIPIIAKIDVYDEIERIMVIAQTEYESAKAYFDEENK